MLGKCCDPQCAGHLVYDQPGGLSGLRRGSDNSVLHLNKKLSIAKKRLIVGRCHSDAANLSIQAQLAKAAAATSKFYEAGGPPCGGQAGNPQLLQPS